jgi:hypothetical protein
VKLNNTTQFTDKMVRRVFRFVAGKQGYTKFVDELQVSPAEPGSRWRGVCKPYMGEIKLWVARPSRFPYTRPALPGGYIKIQTKTDVEALVYVAAHEFRHIWQSMHDSPRLGGGRKGLSERDADTYAAQLIEKWRKRGPKLKRTLVYTPEARRKFNRRKYDKD